MLFITTCTHARMLGVPRLPFSCKSMRFSENKPTNNSVTKKLLLVAVHNHEKCNNLDPFTRFLESRKPIIRSTSQESSGITIVMNGSCYERVMRGNGGKKMEL